MTTCIHCTHNNVRYEWHSDRFYLDEPVANFRTDEAFQSDEGTANSTVSPYFSRSALVESLVDSRELEAVIIQTYSLRLSALKNEFPTLLDPVIPSSVFRYFFGPPNYIHTMSSIQRSTVPIFRYL
jgi:hypothetical protein